MFFQAYRDKHTGIDRCAVHLPSLQLERGNPGFTEELAMRALQNRGLSVLHVDVVAEARKYLGRPHKRGVGLAEAPGAFDCSGLMAIVYGAKGVRLPRIAIDQRNIGPGHVITSVNDLIAGDLVFKLNGKGFYWDDPRQGVGHVGLLTDVGTVIHSSSTRGRVAEDALDRFLENCDFRDGRRVIPSEFAGEVITVEAPYGFDLDSSNTIRWRLLAEMSRICS